MRRIPNNGFLAHLIAMSYLREALGEMEKKSDLS
jgi:hypothetical protein